MYDCIAAFWSGTPTLLRWMLPSLSIATRAHGSRSHGSDAMYSMLMKLLSSSIRSRFITERIQKSNAFGIDSGEPIASSCSADSASSIHTA